MTTKPLKGRLALVTGASRGLGAATAIALARKGADVILLSRNVKVLEEVDDKIREQGGNAILLPFNLLDLDKIDQIGGGIAERFGKLDILIGNAAMLGQLTPVSHTDPKMIQDVFKLNYFANMHLIRSLDGLLRLSDAGRAVFVTSAAAQLNTPYWNAYAASKAALNVLVQTYAAETAYSTLRTHLFDPGVMQTGMRAEAFPGEDPASLTPPEDVAENIIKLITSDNKTIKAA